MRLFTYQGKEFDIHKGHVDHNKSKYIESVPEYQNTINMLSEYLKTDQFLWATTIRLNQPESDCYEYELEVPECKILHILDGYDWSSYIGIKNIPPPSKIAEEIKEMAAKLFPDDMGKRRKYIKCKEKEWQNRSVSEDCFRQDKSIGKLSEKPQYIFPFPVPRDWVVGKN